MASYLHHTATTIYPCCVPALGDSTGAGCVGLAGANIEKDDVMPIFFKPNLKIYLVKKITRPHALY